MALCERHTREIKRVQRKNTQHRWKHDNTREIKRVQRKNTQQRWKHDNTRGNIALWLYICNVVAVAMYLLTWYVSAICSIVNDGPNKWRCQDIIVIVNQNYTMSSSQGKGYPVCNKLEWTKCMTLSRIPWYNWSYTEWHHIIYVCNIIGITRVAGIEISTYTRHWHGLIQPRFIWTHPKILLSQ